MTPPSLHGVRTDTVPPLRRYYGVLRRPASLSPRFVAFAWRYPALRLSFCSHRSRALTAGRGLVIRFPRAGIVRRETTRTSQVPGEPCCSYAVFFDPGRTDNARPMQRVGVAPVASTTKAPARFVFRGSIARPWNSLCTLRAVGRPHRTQHSLPVAGQALPGGIPDPQGSIERFSRCNRYISPPFPSFSWRKDAARFPGVHSWEGSTAFLGRPGA
jgi:hypothetical protein